jgi:hypothetical protein
MPMKLLRLFFALVLMLGCVLMLPSCQMEPTREVDSYAEVKEALAEQRPDIIFPDISKYDEDQFVFKVGLYQGDRRIINGYSAYIPTEFNKGIRTVRAVKGESVLAELFIRSTNEEFYFDELNPIWELEPNTTYRGLDMEKDTHEMTDLVFKDHPSGDLHPLGSRIFAFGYYFTLEGYRYELNAQMVLTPDDLESVDVEEEKDRADAELRALVDSVLDQGGVAK